MNVFNRIVMIILVIILIAAVVFFLVRPMDALNYLSNGIRLLQDQVFDNRFFTYLVIGGAILLFILLLLLILEIRRSRLSIARVQTQGKSDTWLGIQSIAKTLEQRIDELPDVRSVKPRVLSHGKDVEVFIDLDASPKANIVTLTEQVAQTCKDIVETQLGLKIHNRVTIHVTQDPYPKTPAKAAVKDKVVEVKPAGGAVPPSANET